jgi:hypothetical protein
METVRIGNCNVTRFIIGSNPFSGFSHQGTEKDREMIHYWTSARIKAALREAESLGVNTIIARGDHHMLRLLLEYWDEGGTLQWCGQTCPELGPPEPALKRMADAGAPACHIHGGYADHLLARGQLEKLIPTVKYARDLGLVVGLAGHDPNTLRWAEEHLDLDYYMCSYYNPIPRQEEPQHRPGTDERYRDEDRRAMTHLIAQLSKPAIHYKVMAAGRNKPANAFAYVARHLRATDAVCVGIYTSRKPDMLREDVALLEQGLLARDAAPAS